MIIIFIVLMMMITMMISQGCPMLTQDVVSAQYFAYCLAHSYSYHLVHLIHHHVHHHVLYPRNHHHVFFIIILMFSIIFVGALQRTKYDYLHFIHSLSYIWGISNKQWRKLWIPGCMEYEKHRIVCVWMTWFNRVLYVFGGLSSLLANFVGDGIISYHNGLRSKDLSWVWQSAIVILMI